MRRQYFIALGLGIIPLIVFLVAYGLILNYNSSEFNTTFSLIIVLFIVALVSYVVELILTIAFLVDQNRRYLGYGLLTAFLATPIIVAISCVTVPRFI